MRLLPITSLLTTANLVLAAPKQPDFTNTTTLPTHFGLLIFPHYQALDIFGPMDVLNSMFMLYSNKTAPTQLTILSRTLEPVSSAMKDITTGELAFGQAIVPTMTFDEYLNKQNSSGAPGPAAKKENHWGEIEVLFVPGGGGTRQDMSTEIAFVKTVYPKLKYIISICTGATLLSRAGVLDGKRATTNKRSWAWATSTGPNVTWVPTARWVEHGNVFSSSGISAGIDATYAWVSRVYGEPVAEYLALSAEYNRETNSSHDPWAMVWDVPGAV